MKTTCEFLDAVKARHGLPSDYALAKTLGVSHQSIGQYRSGRLLLSDSMAIRVAMLLEIDPGIVIATVHRERAKKDDERAAWSAILEKLGGAAAVALLGLACIAAPSPSYAGSLNFTADPNMDYASRRKRKRSAFAAAIGLFSRKRNSRQFHAL